jgi:putative transposase
MEHELKHLPHLRPFAHQPIIFITTCTHRRRPLLADSQVHSALRAIWERSSGSYGWFVGRYVLMPDHVHLFAQGALDAKPLARWIQTWKSLSSRLIMRARETEPPVWQSDYFDRFLRSDDSYAKKWEYVLANPVRVGLVAHSSDWPFGGTVHELRFSS